MPISASIPLNPVDILKLLYLLFAKPIGYIRNIPENSETLQKLSDDLKPKLKDLEEEVHKGQEQGQKITNVASHWLDEVRTIIDGAPSLIEEANQRGCCQRWCLSCRTSYKLGKKISQAVDRAKELLEERQKIGTRESTIEPPLERVLPIPTSTIEEGTSAAAETAIIKESTSPVAAVDKILRHLGDRRTRNIGIWGPGGIGKSTILDNIYNTFKGTSDFGATLFVKFPNDGSLKTLQRKLSAELSLDLSNEEDENRRRMLKMEFNKKKKFLLILDDVSEVVDWENLGVPEPSEQNGCKILFATEMSEICSRMAVNVEIKLDRLTDEEAWGLFSRQIGDIPDSEIQNIARVVCDECSGLLAFLVSLGASLRNQRFFVWERALGILKSSKPQNLDPKVLAASLTVGVDVDQMQQNGEQVNIKVIEEVLRYLAEVNIKLISIWGENGVGKTRILKDIIHQKFKGKYAFDNVIYAPATDSQNLSMKKLRRDIANEIELQLPDEEDEAAELLIMELVKHKFLLILDDLGESFDFTKLGVPHQAMKRGSKILFASRSKNVCSGMNPDVHVDIEHLTREEAWVLFSHQVGNISDLGIQNIARDVCDKCSGIAAFLNNIGTALRNQKLFMWQRALKELQSPGSKLLDPKVLAKSLIKRIDTGEVEQSVEQASVQSVIEEILSYLTEDHIKQIGIYGMGGVGKTRILKDIIYQKFKGRSLFDVVIYAIASQMLSMKKLRRDIAEQIGLELQDENNEHKTAELLLEELNKKKFLLIIDDLWKSFEFKDLGVPHETMKNGSKILVASRSKDAFTKMDLDKYVHIRTLTREEAWALFQGKVGPVHPDLERTAHEVCEECGCLPLALITTGAAMKNKGSKEYIAIWEHALRVLRDSEFKLNYMEEDVFRILKFSYDMLPSDNHRNCFLYCSLFPEDHAIKIAKLVEYWTMEGFVDGFNKRGKNLRDVYNEGRYLLHHLLDSCLLERDDNWMESVRMHDMIRDTAIKITRDSKEYGRRYMVNARAGLKKWVPAVDMEKKDKISLMENAIKSLVEQPHCPELVTLLLNGNDPLKTIPPKFFSSMALLRVLDLSRTEIQSLPQSMSCLVNLTALILRYCYSLWSIDCIGDLKKLQFLDLEDAGIWELSENLGNLVQLLYFNLSGTSNLQTVPSSVISGMTLLEDLQMKRSSISYSQSLIKAIGNLEQLNSLSLKVSSEVETGWLSKSCKWENINNFNISVGREYYSTIKEVLAFEIYRSLIIQKILPPERNDRCLKLAHVIDPAIITRAQAIIRNSKLLWLHNMPVIETLSQVGSSNLVNLKECWISKCRSLETVVAAEEGQEKTLPVLEILVLCELTNMVCVWDGKQTHSSSFGKVRSIVLYECPKIKYLFRISVLKQLRSLEELKVVRCKSIEAVALGEVESVNVDTDCIDKLRCILLLGLPKLEMLWNGSPQMPSLEVIEVAKCPALQTITLSKSIAPKLQTVHGDIDFVCSTLHGDEDFLSRGDKEIFSMLNGDKNFFLRVLKDKRFVFRVLRDKDFVSRVVGDEDFVLSVLLGGEFFVSRVFEDEDFVSRVCGDKDFDFRELTEYDFSSMLIHPYFSSSFDKLFRDEDIVSRLIRVIGDEELVSRLYLKSIGFPYLKEKDYFSILSRIIGNKDFVPKVRGDKDFNSWVLRNGLFVCEVLKHKDFVSRVFAEQDFVSRVVEYDLSVLEEYYISEEDDL